MTSESLASQGALLGPRGLPPTGHRDSGVRDHSLFPFSLPHSPALFSQGKEEEDRASEMLCLCHERVSGLAPGCVGGPETLLLHGGDRQDLGTKLLPSGSSASGPQSA